MNHVRPSRILSNLVQPGGEGQGYFGLNSLKVRADDEKGVVVVDGDPKDVETFAQYLSLFDAESQKVQCALRFVRPKDHLDFRHTFTIDNSQLLEFSDETKNVSMTFSPRINGDGTITVFLVFPGSQSKVSTVFRVTMNKPMFLVYDPSQGTFSTETVGPLTEKLLGDKKYAGDTFVFCQAGVADGAADYGQRPPLSLLMMNR